MLGPLENTIEHGQKSAGGEQYVNPIRFGISDLRFVHSGQRIAKAILALDA
jgi:hypothetical protein